LAVFLALAVAAAVAPWGAAFFAVAFLVAAVPSAQRAPPVPPSWRSWFTTSSEIADEPQTAQWL